MFRFQNSLYMHPYLNIGIKDGQIRVYSFHEKEDSTEFIDVSSLSVVLIELRDQLREQERKRESQMPTAKETLEQMKNQPLDVINPPQETTTVTFTMQASEISRTIERLKGGNDHAKDELATMFKLCRSLGMSDILHLVAIYEKQDDFAVTFTHTYKHP